MGWINNLKLRLLHLHTLVLIEINEQGIVDCTQ
jgi:hypothetical protein